MGLVCLMGLLRFSGDSLFSTPGFITGCVFVTFVKLLLHCRYFFLSVHVFPLCLVQCGAVPYGANSVRWVEQLMLINLEGPPLKSLLCEMGGATDAGQPRGATPEVFTL